MVHIRTIFSSSSSISMKNQKSIEEIVANEKHHANNQTELAIALHNYVRDNVLFGFTPYFDAAQPIETLKLRLGHCNPQADLMVKLFREADILARFRPATINNEILLGAVTTPRHLSHVFTEVQLNEKWLRLDSYILDPKLRINALERLKLDGLELGYGTHISATGEWDGKTDAYSQVATKDMILELHEPVENIEEFYQSSNYRHRILKVPFSTLMAPARLSKLTFSKLMNYRLERLRNQS